MNRIRVQAAKFWQLLTAPDTLESYKKVGLLTWDILKEAGLLVWLVVCLVLVAFEWLWRTAFGAGQNFRDWINQLEGTGDRAASEAGRALLSASVNSLSYTITQAKTQLGIPLTAQPEPELATTPPPPAPASSPAPAAVPKSPPTATIERSSIDEADDSL
jgi:hypothetical protein